MQEVHRKEILEAEDQIDSFRVKARAEDYGKSKAQLQSGNTLPGCSHDQEAGSMLSFRAEHLADTHPLGFRRVKPRTPTLAFDFPGLPLALDLSSLLMLVTVLTYRFVLSKGLVFSVLFVLLWKGWASGEWGLGPSLEWKWMKGPRQWLQM